jgi:hypothetical protein
MGVRKKKLELRISSTHDPSEVVLSNSSFEILEALRGK